MNKGGKYIIIQEGKVRMSDVVNDCNGFCVPTYEGEPLSSIIKKLCAKIAEMGQASSDREIDPVFTASPSFSISYNDLTHWNTAFNKTIASIEFTGLGTKTLTIHYTDGTSTTADFEDLDSSFLNGVSNTPTVELSTAGGVLSANVIVDGVDNSQNLLVVWDPLTSSFRQREVSSIVPEGLSDSLSALSAAIDVVSNNLSSEAQALSLRIDAISGTGGSGSVTSDELSALADRVSSNSTTMIANDTALFQAVSVLSQRVSIISSQLSDAQSAIAANSATMTSRDNTLSAAINVVSNNLSAEIDNRIAGDSALQTNIDTVSNGLSIETVNRISADSTLQTNINTVSNSLSVEITNRQSADSDLSNKISAVSQQLSLQVSALSQSLSSQAAALSVRIDTQSQNISVVSNALSVETAARLNADSALSIRIDTVSNSLSVETAARIAADNLLSNAISATSQQLSLVASALSTRIDSVSNRLSAISANVTSLQSVASAYSAKFVSVNSAISVNSAQMTSADNAISNAVSIVSVAAAAKNPIITILDEGVTVLSSPVFFDFVGAGIQVSVSANKVVVSVGQTAGSVTSDELSAVSAAAASAISIVSAAVVSTNNRISAISANVTSIQSVVSSLSTRLSALSSQVSSISAQMTSADNAISNAVSIVSAANASVWSTVSTIKFQAVESVSATGYTISAGDHMKVKYFLAGSAISVTLPNGLVSGFQCMIYRAAGAGAITISATTSVEAVALSLNTQKTAATLINKGSDIWLAIGALGDTASVTSAAITSINDRISTLSSQVSLNSTQMISADNAISNAVSIVSVAVTTKNPILHIQNNGASAASSPITLNFKGAGISVSGTFVEISIGTTGGSGSVTSDEASAISAAAASAISIVSAAVVSTNNRISAISANVTSLQSVASAYSAKFVSVNSAISTNSAQMTSADNAISNAVSIVSAAQAVTSAAVTSVNDRISAISANVTSLQSVASAYSAKFVSVNSAISVNSAQMTSADNAISNAVSIVSAAQASTWSVVSTLKFIPTESVTGDAYTISAGDNGKVKYFQNSTSVINVTIPTGLASGFEVVLHRGTGALTLNISAAGGVTYQGQGSALVNDRTGAALHHQGADAWIAHGPFAQPNIDTISNAVSVLSQAVSVLSQAVSVLSVAVGPILAKRLVMVSNTNSIATSTLTNMSALSLTVATGETWRLEGMLLFSTSATGAGLRLGLSVPPLSSPRFINYYVQSGSQSATGAGGGGKIQVSGNSILLSITGVGPAGGQFAVTYDALFNVASAGTVQFMAAAIASATASPLHYLPGSYIIATKLR